MTTTSEHKRVSSDARSITIAATGDSLITQRLSTNVEPEFLRVVEILRGVDVAFTNLETTIHDHRGVPAAQSGGTWMVSPPYVAAELHWAGLRLLSRANNHAMDWAVEGLQETTRILDAHGLTHAGVGDDLPRARQAAFRSMPAGRVALVSATTTFPEWGRAGDPRKDVRGRPGVNALRWSKVHLLSPRAFGAMRSIAAEVGIDANDPSRPIALFDTVFVPWTTTAIGVEANPSDLAANVASVRQARSKADWVVVSLHTHEWGAGPDLPSPVAVTFARQCVEAGADLVLMHGAHVLRGVEIYQGKPIFYGLGNFIYQAQQVERVPADMFDKLGLPDGVEDVEAHARFAEATKHSDAPPIPGQSPHLIGSGNSIVAVMRLVKGAPAEIRLYPVTLGPERSRVLCGYPRLADRALAEEIIESMRRLSAPYGNRVVQRDGYGTVAAGPDT